MRLLVTNDDGIDSVGLHVLARAMRAHGDVVVVAPDREFSGAGAAIGSLQDMKPEISRVDLDGIDEAWAVTGAPALCVFFARLGVFDGPFDLVVAGINPGNNVGRAVYHSGTVGAALTARNSGMSGVAVSQAVAGYGVEGQGWAEMLADMKWETAAAVASEIVAALVADMPAAPTVVNVNVPNVELSEITSWRHAVVGTVPPRAVSSAEKVPVEGREGVYTVLMGWGDAQQLPSETDGGAVERGEVAITYLGPLQAEPRDDLPAIDAALDRLVKH